MGLPPAPAEIEAFLADESPGAFTRLVDRLLASPQYGERSGRHWLDVVRYADTAANPPDMPVPQAYRYRNWVIQAFNETRGQGNPRLTPSQPLDFHVPDRGPADRGD